MADYLNKPVRTIQTRGRRPAPGEMEERSGEARTPEAERLAAGTMTRTLAMEEQRLAAETASEMSGAAMTEMNETLDIVETPETPDVAAVIAENLRAEEAPAPKPIVRPKVEPHMRVGCGIEPDTFQMDPEALKNIIHVVIQSKGGTGKTYVASLLASFFQRHAAKLDLYCFDLDSNSKSFAAFKAFNAMQYSEAGVNEDGEVVINSESFNKAFNPMLEDEFENDSIVVMDTGAGGSFWSLVEWITNLDYPTLARMSGKEWRFMFHVVISGGAIEESVESLARLQSLVDNPYIEFIIWGNEYFGPLRDVYDEIARDYGRMFTRNINLPKITYTDLDRALRMMRDNNWSVSELFEKGGFSKVVQARVNQYFYGNMAKKPGVFRALQQLDWSPWA